MKWWEVGENAIMREFTSFITCIILRIKSRRMRIAGQVVCMGDKRTVYRKIIGNPEGKRPLGRQIYRWVDIKMDLREMGWDGMEIYLVDYHLK
jgi:hypothetical protein